VTPRRASDLLLQLGVERPEEIDIEAIACHCGCKVRYRHLDGCAARLVGAGDRAIISVDENSRLGRRRFSVAHEIAHWMFDRGKPLFECQNADIRTPWSGAVHPEARANAFAADLLMPEALFAPLTRDKPATFDTVDQLRTTFSVSRTAAAYRLVETGDADCMLVCHGPEGRRWFVASRRVHGHFWPHQQLSMHSDAYVILRGEEGSNRSQTVDADDWINHWSAGQYEIREHSVRAGDVVLTLLWWKDTTMVERFVH
jgi:predicted transcriptional regulator